MNKYTEKFGPNCIPDYFIVATSEDDSYFVAFKVYEVFGTEHNGDLLFNKGDMTPVESIDKAAVWLSGDIKWDGCSNLSFDEQERCMLHFCSKEDAVGVGTLLARLYDIADSILGERSIISKG